MSLPRLSVLAAAAAAVLAAAGIAYALEGNGKPQPVTQSSPAMQVAAAAADSRQVPQSRTEMELSFAPLVKQVAPAVVNVYATTISKQSNSPFANDPFFSQLFGRNSPFAARPRES